MIKKMTCYLIVLTYLWALSCGGASTKFNSDKFKDVYKAAKSVQSLAASGLNYSDFSIVTNQLTVEVALAQDLATNQIESVFVYFISKSASMYNDSKVIWAAQIKSSIDRDLQKGFIPVDGPIVEILLRNGYPENELETALSDNSYRLDASAWIQGLWKRAAICIDGATKIFYHKLA